jgi:hypothetical protein
MTPRKRTTRATRPTVRKSGPDSSKRIIAREWVNQAARDFKRTGNPVFAWDAIADCLAAGMPLPAWTREYLLPVAGQIANLSRSSVPSRDAIDRAVARAVGLKGKGRFNPFREIGRVPHELLVAFEVYTYWAAHRYYSWDAIFTDVAAAHHVACEDCKRPLSVGTVKRYWYRRALSVIPPVLIARANSQKLDDILS